MTLDLDHINALTIDICFFYLLPRLGINQVDTPEEEDFYTLDEDVELSMYDRVTLNDVFIKPDLVDMEAELVTYKAELTIIEEARLTEVARKEDLESRWMSMKNDDPGMPAFMQLYKISNSEAYFLDKILNEEDKNLAESRLKIIEEKNVEVVADAKSKEWIPNRKAGYGSVEDQLDEIYHDIDAWRARIKAVKDSNPKSN